MTSTIEPSTIPAAGRFLPVRAYDAIVAATMREAVWRPRLAEDLAARVPAAAAIAEIGAGTGSLTLQLRAALAEETRITAIDPDPRALALARAKPDASQVTWIEGTAQALPLADGTQDAVAMALVLHHLDPDAKRQALAEARRVLRPSGLLYVADFARPRDPLMAAAFTIIQLADGRASTADHRRGLLPRYIAEAGFAAPTALLALRTGCGQLDILRATAPGA